MRKALYMRLAAGNLKKNRQLYGPYLIACIVTVMMMCIMILLEGDRGLNTIEGGQSVAATLMFGCIVIAIFSLIILVYINSLLIKQRKKEFALYNILGMEKRHISKVLFWESAYTAVISIGAGLIFGAVFSKLMQLILMKIIGGEISFNIDVSFSVLVFTAAIFAVFFLLVLLMNIRTIRIAQPVELLRGGSEGEREPKSKWVLAVLGVVFCGVSFLMILFLVIRTLIWGDPVAGWPSMVCVILFMGGIQLLCMGIMGEYLSKTYLESKHRPIYIIRSSSYEKE